MSKVWNYAHVLRDEGIAYGDYLEQITYLLFLKNVDDERDFQNLLGESSAVPDEWKWARLRGKRGDELELQYRHTLENLSRATGMLGTIFRKAQEEQGSGPGEAEPPRRDDRCEETLMRSASGST